MKCAYCDNEAVNRCSYCGRDLCAEHSDESDEFDQQTGTHYTVAICDRDCYDYVGSDLAYDAWRERQ